MNIKHILYFFVFALTLMSCEELIILDLENDEPQLVIEAVVDATLGTVSVQLTESNGFYDNATPKTIDDASISLLGADGESVAIPFLIQGRYFANELDFEEGELLEIQILNAAGELYVARTKVPHSILIDEVEAIETNFGGGGPLGDNAEDTQRFRVRTHWLDVEEQESFYRIKAFRNNTFLANTYTMIDDINMEGQMLSRPIFENFETGDSVQVQLLSINEKMYNYFLDLANIQGQGPNSTTPYNPKGSFENALGYFGIQQSDVRFIVLE